MNLTHLEPWQIRKIVLGNPKIKRSVLRDCLLIHGDARKRNNRILKERLKSFMYDHRIKRGGSTVIHGEDGAVEYKNIREHPKVRRLMYTNRSNKIKDGGGCR